MKIYDTEGSLAAFGDSLKFICNMSTCLLSLCLRVGTWSWFLLMNFLKNK